MPTELEIWNTFWLATLANAAYFVGLAFYYGLALELRIWQEIQITY